MANFAVVMTVVTREGVFPDLVEETVGAMLGAAGQLGASTPAIGSLEPSRIAVEGLTAPLHDAAARAFESGGDRSKWTALRALGLLALEAEASRAMSHEMMRGSDRDASGRLDEASGGGRRRTGLETRR